MKTLLKAVVLAAGLSALLPAVAYEQLAKQRAELNQRIFSKAQSGDLQGALAMANEALTNDERQYGREHAALLGRLYIQHQLSRRLDNKQQLERLEARIGSISKTVLAGRDIEQLYIAGDFFTQINDSRSAEPFFVKVVSLADTKGDADPTWLYRGLGELGRVQGQLDSADGKATATLERLIALREKHQGQTHHDLIKPLRMLARVKKASGEAYYRRVLDIERQHHEANHPSVLRARFQLAEFHADYSTSDKALAALDDYIAHIEKLDPKKSASEVLVEPLLVKARVLADSKAFSEAAQALQRMSAIVSAQPDVSQSELGDTLSYLLAAQRVLGRPGKLGSKDQLERAEQLIEETYQRQLALKDVPPTLTFALKKEQFRHVSAHLAKDHYSSEVDKKAAAQMLANSLKELLALREQHWPADDPMLLELRQALYLTQLQTR